MPRRECTFVASRNPIMIIFKSALLGNCVLLVGIAALFSISAASDSEKPKPSRLVAHGDPPLELEREIAVAPRLPVLG